MGEDRVLLWVGGDDCYEEEEGEDCGGEEEVD